MGQHVQPLRPDVAVRWLQGVRASGARAACTACTPTSGSRTADGHERPPGGRASRRDDRATRPEAAPRAGSRSARPTSCTSAARSRARRAGRSYVVSGADGTPLANACRASRKDVRDAVRAARKAFPGWAAKTAMNRGQVLYRVAELMEGRRDQFVAEVAAAEGLREPRAARRRRPRHRPLGLVRRLGRQDRPGPGLVEPGRARRTSTSRSPSRPASSASSRPRRRRCSGSCRGSPRRSSAATRSCCSPRRRARCPRSRSTEVLATSDVPGGVVNVLTGLSKELVPVLAGARRRRRARHLGRPRRAARRDRAARRRRRQAPVAPPDDRRRGPLRLARRPRRRAPRVDRRLPRDEDGLAPDRDLSDGRPS